MRYYVFTLFTLRDSRTSFPLTWGGQYTLFSRTIFNSEMNASDNKNVVSALALVVVVALVLVVVPIASLRK